VFHGLYFVVDAVVYFFVDEEVENVADAYDALEFPVGVEVDSSLHAVAEVFHDGVERVLFVEDLDFVAQVQFAQVDVALLLEVFVGFLHVGGLVVVVFGDQTGQEVRNGRHGVEQEFAFVQDLDYVFAFDECDQALVLLRVEHGDGSDQVFVHDFDGLVDGVRNKDAFDQVVPLEPDVELDERLLEERLLTLVRIEPLVHALLDFEVFEDLAHDHARVEHALDVVFGLVRVFGVARDHQVAHLAEEHQLAGLE